MIHLTFLDGKSIDVAEEAIRDVQPLGEGAVVYLKKGPPVRATQNASWIKALWKRLQ